MSKDLRYLKKNIKMFGNKEKTIIVELKKIVENNDEVIIKLNIDKITFKIIELRRKKC